MGYVTVTSNSKYNKFYYTGFSRETEKIGHIQIYIKGDLLWELANVVVVVMESEKSHSLPSTSWRPRNLVL